MSHDYAFASDGSPIGEVTQVIAGWLALPPDRNERDPRVGFNGRAYETRQGAVDALVGYLRDKEKRFR